MRRRILLALAAVLAATALLAAVALGTARGRQALLDAIDGLTAGPEFRLEMRGLRLGGEWNLEELTVSDATGPWLRAEGISVRPVLGDLFLGRITLDHLGVGTLAVDRLPAAGESGGGAGLPGLRIRSIGAGEIRIGQAVAGHEARLSLHGAVELDVREARARLQLARLDRDGDALGLEGRVHFTRREMDLRLDLKEAPGGLLHTLAHVNGTEGISLNVSGGGSFHACPLTLEARLSDVLGLAGNATLDLDAGPQMSLKARFTPGPSWVDWSGLPREEADITAHGAWREPALHLNRIDVRSRIADLAGNATWDSDSGDLDARFEGLANDLSAFATPALKLGTASAQAALRLGGDGLHARVQAILADWRLSGKALSAAEADLVLEMPAELDRWQARGEMHVTAPDLPEGMRAWSANATLGGDFASLAIDRLFLASEKIACDLSGRVGRDIDVAARIDVRNIPLGTAATGLSGAFVSTLKGGVTPDARSLSGEMAVNATGIEGLPRDIEELLGRDGRLHASFEAGPERVLIREAALRTRTLVTMNGEFNPASSRFRTVFDATLPALRREGLTLQSGASVRGTAEGDPAAFDVKLTAQSGAVATAGFELSGLRASAALQGLPKLPALSLTAEAQSAGQPASLRVEAAPAGRDVRVSLFLLEAPGTKVQASGELDPSSLRFAGTVDVTSADLGVPGRVLGQDLQGSVAARAELTRGKDAQHVRIEGGGEGIGVMGLNIGRASVKGVTVWPEPLRGTDIRITLDSVAKGALKADRITGALRGAGQGLAFDLGLSRASAQTDIEAKGIFSPSPARLRVDTLQGTVLRERVQLESPLDATWDAGRAEWREAVLTFGRARLASRGTVAPDRTDVWAELRDLDPATLRAAFPGMPAARVNGRLHVQGSPTDPDALFEMEAREIRVKGGGIGNLQGLAATAQARLGRDRLEARASVASASGVALGVELACPVRAELTSVDVSPDAPLTGRIGGYAELGILPTLLRLDDQAVAGKCELDLEVGGTWSNPALAGSAKVRGGRYENFRSGTAVEAADVDALARGSVVELNATATDGGSGKAVGRGTVDLEALTYVFDVDLTAFRLMRLDLIQGTAAGPFRFGGDLDAAALSGNLTLDPAAIVLPRSTAKEAPHIDVREINAGAAGNHKTPSEPHFLIGMDLNVGIPARLTVKGRGLDSEWAGRLHIGGSHVRPAVSGEMNLLRGTFDFLDRVFDLTKGSLLLAGDTPPNPFLDMLGETRVLDTLVQVHLNGPARSFRLSLTSVPALPQDELLAMILFGRSMREISPLQAVALAQAAAEMAGVGSDLDVLGAVKSRLGLQEVDVRKDEEDETSVGVGGYVGGKYYIRTQRSVSGQDRTKVEVQLTPKISVETEVGADSRQGAGISWKHDY
jgi:translocation and assembly module TamB